MNLYGFVGNGAVIDIDLLGFKSIIDHFHELITPQIGSINLSFTWVIPIAPPAITVNPSVSVSGSGAFCCDRATGDNRIKLSVSISCDVLRAEL